MGAITTALLVAGSIYQGVESHRQARKQNRAAKKAEALENRRQRMQAFRQARIAQAQVAAAEAGSGFTSSGSAGQQAAIATNTTSSIGFATQLNELRQQQLDAQRRAQNAQLVGSLAQLPASAYNAYAQLEQNKQLLAGIAAQQQGQTP
jgi:hypothetical protein